MSEQKDSAKQDGQIDSANMQEVQAQRVEVSQSGVQYVSGEHVTLEKSGALTLKATHASLSQSGAGILTGEQVSLDETSSAGVLLARRVDGVRVNSGLLLAGEVYGNVETTVDTRGALLIGLGLGIGLGLILSLKSLFQEE